jgi:hypothetical protein
MDYNEIDIENEVNRVVTAVEQGKYRQATKRETMAVRLAALSAIVHEMQEIVKTDKELVSA